MTIDEWLERRTEGHEALTQAVELTAAENRARDKRMAAQDKRIGEIMEGIAKLLLVAEIHEKRLSDLEGL
jgi:hypothetical protein